MKMIYGGVPVNSLKVKHYEISTNDATLQASDLQTGVTAYAKGQKVTGTGKAFEFAVYGDFVANDILPIPSSNVNTVILSAVGHTVTMLQTMKDIREMDFSSAKNIATIDVNGENLIVSFQVANNIATFSCSQPVTLQVMFGKDNYV